MGPCGTVKEETETYKKLEFHYGCWLFKSLYGFSPGFQHLVVPSTNSIIEEAWEFRNTFLFLGAQQIPKVIL